MGKNNKFLDFMNRHSKKFIIGVVVLAGIALAAMGGLWWSYRNYNVLAVVDGKKITRSDYNEFAYSVVKNGTPENPSLPEDKNFRAELLNALIEKKIIELEAEKLNLSVSDKDAIASLKKYNPQFLVDVAGSQQTIEYEKYTMLKKLVSDSIAGNKFGSFVIAREDVYYPEDGKVTATLKEKITDSQAYAKSFIEGVYTKLTNKNMTFAEAIELENNDKTIGQNANPTVQTIHSGNFSVDEYRGRVGIVSHREVLDAINQTAAGETSDVIHVVSPEPIAGEFSDIGWIIIRLDEKSGDAGQSYKSWLDAQKISLGVEILGDTNAL